MKILIISIVSVIILGALFVQWANKPENVAALKKQREEEAAQKVIDEKEKAAEKKADIVNLKEIEVKKTNLKLVVNENFTKGKPEKLDFRYPRISYFNFENHEFNFAGMVMKGQNQQDYFLGTKDDFSDFVAEIQVGIWGGDAYTGIFWDARENGDMNPKGFQAAYSSPGTLHVKTTDDDESFSLGGIISSENNQLIRVERFGKYLKVSVNGRLISDQKTTSAGKGKVGILIGHRGGIRDNTQSISIGIKSFKVWE